MAEFIVVVEEKCKRHLKIEAESKADAVSKAENIDLISLWSEEDIDGVEVVHEENRWDVISAALA